LKLVYQKQSQNNFIFKILKEHNFTYVSEQALDILYKTKLKLDRFYENDDAVMSMVKSQAKKGERYVSKMAIQHVSAETSNW